MGGTALDAGGLARSTACGVRHRLQGVLLPVLKLVCVRWIYATMQCRVSSSSTASSLSDPSTAAGATAGNMADGSGLCMRFLLVLWWANPEVAVQRVMAASHSFHMSKAGAATGVHNMTAEQGSGQQCASALREPIGQRGATDVAGGLGGPDRPAAGAGSVTVSAAETAGSGARQPLPGPRGPVVSASSSVHTPDERQKKAMSGLEMQQMILRQSRPAPPSGSAPVPPAMRPSLPTGPVPVPPADSAGPGSLPQCGSVRGGSKAALASRLGSPLATTRMPLLATAEVDPGRVRTLSLVSPVSATSSSQPGSGSPASASQNFV